MTGAVATQRLLALLLAALLLAGAATAPAHASGSDDSATDEDASAEDDKTNASESNGAEDDKVEETDDATGNDTGEDTNETAESDADDPDAPDEADAPKEEDEPRETDEAEDAEDDRDETQDERDESEDEREIRVEIDEDEVRFHASDRRGGDPIDVRFRARDATIQLERPPTADAPRPSPDLHLDLPLLIEYQDVDADGRYGLADRLVQTFDVRGLPANVTRSADGRTVTSYTLPGGGAFEVVLGLRSAAGAPEEAKMDFVFRDFPYERPDSSLALRLVLRSQAAAPEADADGVRVVANGTLAYFRWVDWALVDGARRDVLANVHAWTPLSQDRASAIVVDLSYPRGDDIVHDPVLGFAPAPALAQEVARALGQPAAYAAAAAATAALALGLAWARTRR